MEIHFILVEPAVPENIGASARAIKTMGFTSLRLVRPQDFPNEKANWLAHGSTDILQSAKIFPDLENAIEDLDFVIGSSAKKRCIKHDYYPVTRLREILEEKGNSVSRLGIVFGREESGLSNEELDSCDMVSYIPMTAKYPSLNLSQAVMLFAFHLSDTGKEKYISSAQVGHASYRMLKTRVVEILISTGMDPESSKFKRILERLALVGEKDINLIHSISNKILAKFREETGCRGTDPE